jgi:tRNA1(Val) A37 N6-methylase TrmN6
MNRKHLLENKYSAENIILIISIDFHRRIIELGAGSGLLGLALLKYSEKILSYTFTDYSPMILNLLRQNTLLNFSENQLDVIK